MSNNTISLSTQFLADYRTKMSSDEQKVIRDFLKNYRISNFGIPPLCGKNKSSDDTKNSRKKMFAQTNQLYHYHIGLPSYTNPTASCGCMTSRDVLSYTTKCTTTIKLVKLHSHPPFNLPNYSDLIGEVVLSST